MIKLTTWLMVVLLCCVSFNVEAAKKKKPRFKPYIMSSSQTGEFAKVVSDTRLKITNSDFKLVGDYSPYESAHVFVLTNLTLLKAASESEFGGYGAVIRLAVTDVEGEIQVSYVNPTYMTNLYQMAEVPDVSAELAKTFGKEESFGSKRGKTKRKLKGYHYTVFMPYFDDHLKLDSFDSHQQAFDTINTNLDSGKYQLTKVFEVAIPGKDEVLIGVSIGDGEGADSAIMPIIDTSKTKHTAHLPYSILVSGDKAYCQAGEFRIASSFPDLGMGTFMTISGAPDAIKNSLKQLTTK